MSLVENALHEPLSNASTVPVSSNASQHELDVTTTTRLEKAVAQKVASSSRARDSRLVFSTCVPEPHSFNGPDEMVQFKGLYVVRGPTDSKHVHYTMDITVAELQLRGRCIQRFHSFFRLRKGLLEVLKTCRGRLSSRKSTLTGLDDEPQLTAGAELVKILTRPRCIQCPECEATYDQLAAVSFPRRTLFPPSLQDVHERSQLLETFLDYCVGIATTWPACQRSKRLFIAALGEFLGINMKAYVATQHEGGGDTVSEARTIVRVNILDEEKEPNDSDKTEVTSAVVHLPFSHNENVRSGNYDDDCHSEPNVSFVSNPWKDGQDKDAGMVRSKSHGC